MSRHSYPRVYLSIAVALLVMLSGNATFARAAAASSDSSKSTASRGSGRSGGGASTRSGNRGGSRGSSPSRVSGSSTHRRGGSSHRRGSSHRSGRSYRHGYSAYFSPFYGGYYQGSHGYYGGLFSYYGPHFGLSYYGGHGGRYGYGGYSEGYSRGVDYPSGALDLNVKPKKTGVYLDGQYIGTTGSYDGYPRHLWVEEGYHEITFYLEGFRNETRRVRVQRGAIVDLSFGMQPGEATRPEERSLQIDPRTDRERDRADWSTDRYSQRDSRTQADEGRIAREESDQGLSRSRDLRSAPGRLRISIEPGDSTVYVDGRFLGTGRELSDLHSGLILESGKHKLDVVRPGFDGESVDFLLDEGSEIELKVELVPKERGEEV